MDTLQRDINLRSNLDNSAYAIDDGPHTVGSLFTNGRPRPLKQPSCPDTLLSSYADVTSS
jgi:hypothetical protein